jgi:hypothetical protein
LREIHHRVNNLQVISSLLNLQSKYVDDQKAAEAIKTAEQGEFYVLDSSESLSQRKPGRSMWALSEKLSESLFQSYNIDPGRIKLEVQVDQSELDVDTDTVGPDHQRTSQQCIETRLSVCTTGERMRAFSNAGEYLSWRCATMVLA